MRLLPCHPAIDGTQAGERRGAMHHAPTAPIVQRHEGRTTMGFFRQAATIGLLQRFLDTRRNRRAYRGFGGYRGPANRRRTSRRGLLRRLLG